MFGFKKNMEIQNSTVSAPFAKKVFEIFSDCADFSRREIKTCGGLSLMLCALEGCVSSTALAEEIIRPLTYLRASSEDEAAEAVCVGGIYAASVKRTETPEDTAAAILAGSAALLFSSFALCFDIKTDEHRSIEAPTAEKAMLGGKDAFTEPLRVNTALVRRRLQTPALKLRELTAGQAAKTKLAVFYREGSADPAMLAEIEALLSEADTVLSAGDIERALSGKPRSSFPQLLHTERPDRFVQGLMRGEVGLICDGLPLGFLLPGTLPGMLRVAEDRARHRAVASVLYTLRWAALLLSLLLPELYVAVAMYHQEMIPYKLLLSVIEAKQSVPFSTAAEVLGMILSFELLQEAGLRLPESIGQTVSIIGALIVGQSAVEAKVLSPIVIIVVAMAGIGGYAQPSQELSAAVRLWRFILVLCAAVLGMYGVMAGLMLLLWRLCDTECLGVALMFPLCDRK